MLKLFWLRMQGNAARTKLMRYLHLPLTTPDNDVTLAYISSYDEVQPDQELEKLYDNWRKIVLEIKRNEQRNTT